MEQLRIVAEAAEGYAADWGKELALVELAARAGASAIKFQLLYPDELLIPAHPLYGLVRDLQLPPDRWRAVAERAREMEVELLLDVFGERGLALGFQAYPTPVAENRLRHLRALREAFPDVALGFADHTGKGEDATTWLPALAVALGATYVEKHITMAHVLRDPDHESALAPDRFAQFVESMRLAEAALGEPAGADEMGEEKRAYRLKMKKHAVATRNLDEAVGPVLASEAPGNAPLTRGDLR